MYYFSYYSIQYSNLSTNSSLGSPAPFPFLQTIDSVSRVVRTKVFCVLQHHRNGTYSLTLLLQYYSTPTTNRSRPTRRTRTGKSALCCHLIAPKSHPQNPTIRILSFPPPLPASNVHIHTYERLICKLYSRKYATYKNIHHPIDNGPLRGKRDTL
jgi:hypothetical protein